MGEVLGEVFALAAKDGESMKDWTSRVTETFERCRRKAKVDFPTEARGWISLHCAGTKSHSEGDAGQNGFGDNECWNPFLLSEL